MLDFSPNSGLHLLGNTAPFLPQPCPSALLPTPQTEVSGVARMGPGSWTELFPLPTSSILPPGQSSASRIKMLACLVGAAD